jgi:hypothetical protein
MRQISIRLSIQGGILEKNVNTQDIKGLCKTFAKYGRRPYLNDVNICCKREDLSVWKDKIVEDLKEFVMDTSLGEIARKICDDVIDKLLNATG